MRKSFALDFRTANTCLVFRPRTVKIPLLDLHSLTREELRKLKAGQSFLWKVRFGLHALTGNRAGSFAMTVTKNWRMTFVKIDDQTIADLDLEDYH